MGEYWLIGHLSVISTNKTPFIECIIPFIASYNWQMAITVVCLPFMAGFIWFYGIILPTTMANQPDTLQKKKKS